MATPKHFERVLSKLVKYGFLLQSDPKLPSVCGLITGGPLSGSWWSHPLAHEIFRVNEQLQDHDDVLITKLISGKVTFVHRELWSEILAIGSEKGGWQTAMLSAAAKELLMSVEKAGSLRTDQIKQPRSSGHKQEKPGETAKDLERRLLVHSDQIHTESGAHAKVLETWEHWAKRNAFAPTSIRSDEAKKDLEARLRKLNEEYKANARLPWIAR
jgi:hypothetical protein